MPLYEFGCDTCGKCFDILCHSSVTKMEHHEEDPYTECKGMLERQISAPSGVVLKGTGFTDGARVYTKKKRGIK